MTKAAARRRRRRWGCLPRLLVTLLVLAAAVGWFWWQQNGLSSETISVTSAPDGFAGYRIAVISDLHGKEFGEDNEKLIDYVRDLEPDLIAVTGDLIHDQAQMAMVKPVAKGLASIAPTYYVTGNHEWAAGKMQETAALLADCGVTWLHNGFVTLQRGGDSLLLAGIDDPNGYADQKTPQQVAREVRDAAPEGFWLLLAHRNNLFESEYAALGADLTLSGHGHGGLWRLPFTDGLLGSGGTLLPSYTNGFYTCRGAEVFVSRGLGGMVRLFNRPEVAVLTLRRA